MSITLNDLTKFINQNKQFPKIDISINENYIQPHLIPENIMRNDFDTNLPIVEEKVNIYKENEILEIPSELNELLDLNNYYIFGCFNLVDSILMAIDEDYKLQNRSGKEESINKFIKEIREKLDSLYSQNSDYFEKNKIRKNKIHLELNQGHYKLYLIRLVCTLKEINITLLNLEKDLYLNFKGNSDRNIILINIDSHFVPLIHIYNYSFSNENIESIISNFNEYLNLKSLNSYNIKELQLLALQKNIDINENVNSKIKKKTKQQLYDELICKCTI